MAVRGCQMHGGGHRGAAFGGDITAHSLKDCDQGVVRVAGGRGIMQSVVALRRKGIKGLMHDYLQRNVAYLVICNGHVGLVLEKVVHGFAVLVMGASEHQRSSAIDVLSVDITPCKTSMLSRSF